MQKTLLTLFALTLLLPAAKAQSSAEQTLLDIANKARAEQGTPALIWDPALAQAARTHAERMHREGDSGEHQYPGEPDLATRAAHAGAHFSTVSENIAAANTRLTDIAHSWITSAVHSANILNPRHDHIGVAVIDDHGTLYAVEDFAKSSPTLEPDDVEAQARQALQSKGIQPASSEAARHDARLTCDTLAGSTPGLTTHPILILQWDGADLNQLPEAVLKQAPDATHHTAALASCPKPKQPEANSQPFTTFHIAVLLY